MVTMVEFQLVVNCISCIYLFLVWRFVQLDLRDELKDTDFSMMWYI